jgi:hypothetical protein
MIKFRIVQDFLGGVKPLNKGLLNRIRKRTELMCHQTLPKTIFSFCSPIIEQFPSNFI